MDHHDAHAHGLAGFGLTLGTYMALIPPSAWHLLTGVLSALLAGVAVPVGVAWVQSKTREFMYRRECEKLRAEVEALKAKVTA